MSRTIIIGDVHGCYQEMMELLHLISPTASDQVYFTGDLINKGPDSDKVIREVHRQGYRSVLGNHEWSYLKWFSSKTSTGHALTPHKQPKYQLLDKLHNNLNHEEKQWIATLPFYINTSDFILLHAGVFPNRSLPAHRPYEILNVRNIDGRPWHELYHGKKTIVYGHWAIQGLLVKDNSIGLDTGCVYGKQLTALILPSREIIQVPSHTSVL